MSSEPRIKDTIEQSVCRQKTEEEEQAVRQSWARLIYSIPGVLEIKKSLESED